MRGCRLNSQSTFNSAIDTADIFSYWTVNLKKKKKLKKVHGFTLFPLGIPYCSSIDFNISRRQRSVSLTDLKNTSRHPKWRDVFQPQSKVAELMERERNFWSFSACFFFFSFRGVTGKNWPQNSCHSQSPGAWITYFSQWSLPFPWGRYSQMQLVQRALTSPL